MLIDNPQINQLTGAILGAAIEVHSVLGPGLLESTYAMCLEDEFEARGIRFAKQFPVPLVYKSKRLDSVYRVDLLVEELVVVEVKCLDSIAPVHKAQVLTYLRLTGCPAGLLINFNSARLMDGVKRLINPLTANDVR